MTLYPTLSGKPVKEAWTQEHLEHERDLALGSALLLPCTLPPYSLTSLSAAYINFPSITQLLHCLDVPLHQPQVC